ncbi:MAG: DEAD/DEAH box helicase [Methanotrichaceae archaeon]|nr:DEAD/DEAH box helicase [Methanotrichaceae archaeon]
MTSYLEHPLLRPGSVEKRLFQLDLAVSALSRSTLVVLPTGLGKTVVALMALLARLEKGRVLFLAPTRPLVEQHASFLKRVLLDPSTVAQITGETPAEERMELFEKARVVAATPQVIENDLLSRRIDISDVSLIIFDEAHRAVGNYAYVYIASRYARDGRDRLVLGITASPGSQEEKIQEVCANLGIEAIETRSEDDPDVSPFVYQRDVEWVKVKVPDEIIRLRRKIEEVLEERIEELNRLGIPEQVYGPLGRTALDPKASKGALLELQSKMSASVARQPNQVLYRGISILAEVMKLKHAVELAETQGMDALSRYFARLEGEARSRGGSKASRRLMEDVRIQETLSILATMDLEHPKLAAAKEVLDEQIERKPDSLIMVFTNYRDTASALLSSLAGSPTIRPVRFVGQSSRQDDKGLTQRKQAEVLDKFRKGEYNVLIATSVGEEGIDIPATDMVLFYEPVPSEIRSIQRKGRTGRARAGRVVVLMAKGTRDEAYHWISDRKEKSMRRQIRDFTLSPAGPPKDEVPSLDAFPSLDRPDVPAEEHYQVGEKESEGGDGLLSDGGAAPAGGPAGLAGRQSRITDVDAPSVLVDPRERDVARELEALGVEVRLLTLEVGDYVASERLGIERKTAQDFVACIVDPDRGLFRQVGDLSRSFEKPLLILEGSDLYTRQIHPNAIRGALASIAIDFGVPVLPTADIHETAALIALLARREQASGGREVKPHGKKTARTLVEQQEYLLTAIPSVGPSVARNLLRHFGSLEKVMTATYDELMEVEKVGPKIAERIRELVGGEYKG